MAPKKPAFRWTPEQETWLLARVIDDAGRSKKDINQAQWQKSIVADFEVEFPCHPQSKVNEVVETEAELMQRWNENPRRIRRWIGNHQESILKKHAENKPQSLRQRLAPKRTKQIRSKNARDMAKAHHPDLKAKWTDLHQQFKTGKITKSEMLAEYNKAVTVLLEDERWKTHFTAMASRQEPTQKLTASASTVTDLQIVQYVPSLPMSTATDANAIQVQPNGPGVHLERERRSNSDSYLGIEQGGPTSGKSAINLPHTPPGPAPRDDVEAMVFDSICSEPQAPDGVASQFVIASPGRVPQPTSYTFQQTAFDGASLQSIAMDVDPSSNYSSYVRPINEWLAHNVTTPRTVEAFQLHQSFPNPTNRHAYIDTSSSIGYPLDTHNCLPVQSSYVQSSAYPMPPLPQITDDSHMDQNRPPRTIESHNLSSIDTHSASSTAAGAAPRDGFKDWSPAGGWHLQKVFRDDTCGILCLAFSNDGRLLAYGSGRTIRMWNVETGETVLGPLEGHTDWVFCVAFSRDDRRIVSGSDDRTVRIWDVQTGHQVVEFIDHTDSILSVGLSSDGSKVISSDNHNNILIWDVNSEPTVRCRSEKLEKRVDDFHFSADDRFIIGLDENKPSIWDVKSGKRVPTSLQEGYFGDFVWFGYDALYACMDGKIRRWSKRGSSPPEYDSALSPDRKWIASVTVGVILLYSRDPCPEELVSVDEIDDRFRRFTLVEEPLDND